MSLLVLVRHGQASLLAEDYDRLSDVGWEQARALGRHFAEIGFTADAVYVGPRERHRGTHQGCAEAMADAGRALPEVQLLQDLDEHHGNGIMGSVLPRLAEQNPKLRPLLNIEARGDETGRRDYLIALQRVLRSWATGDIESPEGHEPWPAFRTRVSRALGHVLDAHQGGQTVLCFTSGGFIAAAVGHVLELKDEKIVELSWTVRNASFTELLFSPGRVSLRAFNTLPPLEVEQHTYV